ncbi:acyltransferase domain-containing protein [Actinocrinis sp.]|uniref:acyltransferase domain-containing protein n=1 Tax=Actinocrinis sp. TaxID=1920516 RepID=UPI002CC892A0|nr:acyltransferase domain-containing protein [Actinocrinis sp.]HXR70972.1 acyltransferase domain-containing protein [Actinocrinis sp.]
MSGRRATRPGSAPGAGVGARTGDSTGAGVVTGTAATVLAFPGQGSQFPGMTARLYLGHVRYRAHLEAAAEALGPYTSSSIIDLVVGGDARIWQTGFAQPALFAVEYALATTLIESGVRPAAVLGQGVGELAAAVIAGALSLDDAALLVATRGAFMHFLPPGGMLAVRVGARGPGGLLDGPLSDALAREPAVTVSAFNGPRDLVLSGEPAALGRVGAALRRQRVATLPLAVPHAFHCALMQPVLGRYHRVLSRVSLGAPSLAFYSTVRGGAMRGEALDAQYWAEHVTAPILFARAAERLTADLRSAVIVEVGPRPSLGGLLRRRGGGADTLVCVSACPSVDTDAAGLNALAERLVDGRIANENTQERWTAASAA